jgi:hypothetical protein
VRLEYLLFRAIRYDLTAVVSFFFQIEKSSLDKVTRVIASDCEGGYRQIRSSAWLEHYTDNVGVSSSNLLGSTKGSEG